MSQWMYKLFYKASAWSYVPSLSSVGDLAMPCDHGLQLFLKLPEIVPQLLLAVVQSVRRISVMCNDTIIIVVLF